MARTSTDLSKTRGRFALRTALLSCSGVVLVMADRNSSVGRGEHAVADMKERLREGWTVSDLWDRFADPDGFTYDMAPQDGNYSS